jgi:sugar lactone lactonase YvrE
MSLLAAILWMGLAATPAAMPSPRSVEPARPAKTAPELVAEARKAYARGDRALFVRDYEEAARLRPGDAFILYNLACARALDGRTAEALEALTAFGALRVAADLDSDDDLASLRGAPEYARVRSAITALRKERISSGAVVAFTVPEKALVPEGVAYDPVTKAFFLASIHRRKILRVAADGRISDFVAPGRDGLQSAMGMAADPKRRALWVVSSALPRREALRKGEPFGSALLEFDLDTGRLRGVRLPPASAEPPLFDDLAVGADGRVFVNDSRRGRIFTAAPGRSDLALLFESSEIRGVQGLALAPGGGALYFSDYSGLWRLELAGKKLTRFAVPPDLALNGIDGLASFGGALVAVQNGIQPNRVIRLDLTPDGAAIARARILEMNHPAFDEPTLGVVVSGALYFTADSQGERFRDEKHPVQPEEMRDAVVLKLPLE